MTITDDDLKEWEGLCERATEGPWHCSAAQKDGYDCDYYQIGPRDDTPNLEQYEDVIADVYSGNHDGGANAHFIRTARTALPRLIAEVRKHRERERTAWKGLVKQVGP